MTTQFKTKSQVKQEQTASQDKPSQDVSNDSIPTIGGLESSLQVLYTGHRLNARQVTQGIKVQAYQDEFEEAIAELKRGEVKTDFLQTLQNNYLPVLDQALMPLLSQSLNPVGVETMLSPDQLDQFITRLLDRKDALLALDMDDLERDELADITEQLKELGVGDVNF